MEDGSPVEDDPEDAAALERYADILAGGIEAAIGPWVERVVAEVAGRWNPQVAAGLSEPASAAGIEATQQVAARVRELLATDVDHQRTGPLALIREAVRYPTAVLAEAGVPEVDRDAFTAQAFPGDLYDLSPATFGDLDPELHEPGLVWGAAKAHVVLARRRREGRSG